MQFLDTKFREGDGAIRGVKGRLGAMPLQPAVVRPPAPICYQILLPTLSDTDVQNSDLWVLRTKTLA